MSDGCGQQVCSSYTTFPSIPYSFPTYGVMWCVVTHIVVCDCLGVGVGFPTGQLKLGYGVALTTLTHPIPSYPITSHLLSEAWMLWSFPVWCL